jgi:hypothetical protein
MKRLLAALFLLSLFCLFIPGCASNWTKNNGSYAQDDNIKIMFETYETVPGYKYYFTGYATSPDAIVGIQQDYELEKVSGWANKTNWQQFETDGEKLKELVEAMGIPRRSRPFGYHIKSPDGEQIGVMYTTRWGTSYTTEIRLKDGNLLAVTPHKYNSTFAPTR